MKKLLMILIIAGMGLGLSGVTYAELGSYTICSQVNSAIPCANNAGPDHTYGIYDVFTQTGVYTFSVLDGSWQTDTLASGPTWEWSLYIWQEGTGDHLLGDDTTRYSSQTAALAGNLGSSLNLNVTAGETLLFYLKDNDTSTNFGNVTVAVAPPVVPEPISSVLFLTGGIVLVGRKYLKKRKA